ncbi:MAG: META domain-containing protein [Myxococcota bacterium]
MAPALVRFVLCLTVGLTAACNKDGNSKKTTDALNATSPTGVMSIEGMYTYMADAGVLQDCATGVRWRVATEGDNATLEAAYANARSKPGAPLLVTVEGRLELRPRIDKGGKENVLIVERFDRVWPREVCGSLVPARLEGVVWSLLELNGKPIVVSPETQAPTLEFNAAKKSAYGFGGCNRFFGSYDKGADKTLTLGSLGATRMACPGSGNQEQAFLTALGQVDRYEIHGSKLLLYRGTTVLARFQAQNLLKTE